MNSAFSFSDTNKRYHTYSYAMKKRFGGKVSRIGLDGGFTCPNMDGKVGVGGCAFCGGSAPDTNDTPPPTSAGTISTQFLTGAEAMGRKWDTGMHIAYLQTHTNTYWGRDVSDRAGLARLRTVYTAALDCPGVVGLSIATRPDCLPEAVCDLLAELAERTYLTVELGLQSVHDETGYRMNRGHGWNAFCQGYERLQRRGIYTGVHLIDGLPGETPEMMIESARVVGALRPHLIKFHMLYVAEGTVLAEEWKKGRVPLFRQEEFVEVICNQLERIPPECIIGRLTGDGPPERLLAPLWSVKKRCVLNAVDLELSRRNAFQGSHLCLI